MTHTRYRVTARFKRGDMYKKSPMARGGGKRICTDAHWDNYSDAQRYADNTNSHYPGANARVVKDSARVRGMIP